MAVEVHPTGDGPATEEDCLNYEYEINDARAEQQEAQEAWNLKGATGWSQTAESLENEATDAGCFIIW